MLSRLLPLPALLLAAACTTGQSPPPRAAIADAPPPVAPAAAGLDRVIGHDARALMALFGPPALDIREGRARKLQFRGAVCVLDAYLYPPSDGAEPLAKWIDARTGQGDDLDRASCIAALARVSAGRAPAIPPARKRPAR